jgi:hypothetical protein
VCFVSKKKVVILDSVQEEHSHKSQPWVVILHPLVVTGATAVSLLRHVRSNDLLVAQRFDHVRVHRTLLFLLTAPALLLHERNG